MKVTKQISQRAQTELGEAGTAALAGEILQAIFDQMTAISDEVMQHIPNTGNP